MQLDCTTFSKALTASDVLLTPTRRSGGTLDLIVTKSEQVLVDMTVDPLGIISDHSLVASVFLSPLSQGFSSTERCEVDQESTRTVFVLHCLSQELCSA